MEELIPIFLFLCIAAVLILRPISTRAGKLLEAMAKERTVNRAGDAENARIRVILEHTARRLDLIEERLDFTERLVGGSRRTARNGADPLDRLAAGSDPLDLESEYLRR